MDVLRSGTFEGEMYISRSDLLRWLLDTRDNSSDATAKAAVQWIIDSLCRMKEKEK